MRKTDPFEFQILPPKVTTDLIEFFKKNKNNDIIIPTPETLNALRLTTFVSAAASYVLKVKYDGC